MQLQTVQNKLPWFFIKDMNQSKINLPSVNPKPIHRASTQYQCIQHQPNSNAHSIHLNSMLMATDFLLVGFPSLKTFTLRSLPPTLSFCAEPKVKSQNSSSQKIVLSLRERGGSSQTMVGEGQTKTLSPTPHPFGGYLFPKEKVSSAY